MNNAATTASIRTIDSNTTSFRSDSATIASRKVQTAYSILKMTFSAVPIVAGLDKFTNLLANWESYLNPTIARFLPINAHLFMEVAGVIEIVAGILVYLRPRVGGLVVAGWLFAIALSLLASGHYLDVAVRDLVMAVAAYSLATLAPRSEARNN